MTDTVTSAASVSITGLHKSYGKNEVLRGIDIQVEPGEVVCLIGLRDRVNQRFCDV